MITTEKATPDHLARKAILYVRQSSVQQVLHNRESRQLQYAMRERLSGLGWSAIEVIDEDLGKSAGGGVVRGGFERMVAEVSLGRVGVVAARELSRFARNSREWQRLIDVCRIVDTLLADEETIYDPRQGNDRLLLGVKGSLSEYELDLLRQRAEKARQQKAERGQLGMNAPVGYINAGEGRQEKSPDLRVQQAIRMIFEKFLELGSARQVLMWLIDQGVSMPGVRCEAGEWSTRWRPPTYHAIVRILKHPGYAGAYAWGRTGMATVLEEGGARRISRRKSQERWLVLQKGHHEGYIDWETHERIQRMIHANVQACAAAAAGAAKRGSALLSGLIRCRRCGRKLRVRYTGGGLGSVLRYACRRGFEGNDEPRCISFGGMSVDDAVTREVLRVVQPGAVEAALRAEEQVRQRHDEGRRALEMELDAARYDADRARRQFDASDPEHRLVTAELERCWNAALGRVAELERRLAQADGNAEGSQPPAAETLLRLAADVAAVWEDPRSDVRLKKRIIRALIEEIVVDVDEEGAEVIVLIHWKGGGRARGVGRRPPRSWRPYGCSRGSAPTTASRLGSRATACVPAKATAGLGSMSQDFGIAMRFQSSAIPRRRDG